MTSLFRLVLALVVLAGLNSCGSGAVSGPPPVNDPTRITIVPTSTPTAPVVAYSGLPTVFTVSGGTGAYIAGSSNQAVIPLSGPISNTQFTVVPNYVTAATTVTITIRDTGTAPTVSVTITVQPGTVNNNVTVTPSSTQSDCGAGIVCSGGDALVSTTISQGGIPLAARSVRFSVVTGTFSFVTTTNGIDSLTSTVDVVTDETGKAVARIRVPANAANQSALVQITDLGTGTFQRTSFTIAQSTGSAPGFSVLPASITFQGPQLGQCAGADGSSGAQFTIVGGAPPYTVSSSASPFSVSPTFVTQSGGTFVAKPNGQCAPDPGVPLIVVDSSGHTATATALNVEGTATPVALSVSPNAVTLTSCSGTASATIAGGMRNSYFATSGSDVLIARVAGSTVTIQRANPSSAPPTGSPPPTVAVGVSDGTTTTNVNVSFSGEAAGACPPAIQANPTSVTLNSCAAQTVALSGGSGAYAANSSDPNVTATVTGSTLSIARTSPSASFAPSATITVVNGSAQTTVAVNGTGAGLGACP
jgi:hypothetical protein